MNYMLPHHAAILELQLRSWKEAQLEGHPIPQVSCPACGKGTQPASSCSDCGASLLKANAGGWLRVVAVVAISVFSAGGVGYFGVALGLSPSITLILVLMMLSGGAFMVRLSVGEASAVEPQDQLIMFAKGLALQRGDPTSIALCYAHALRLGLAYRLRPIQDFWEENGNNEAIPGVVRDALHDLLALNLIQLFVVWPVSQRDSPWLSLHMRDRVTLHNVLRIIASFSVSEDPWVRKYVRKHCKRVGAALQARAPQCAEVLLKESAVA